MYKLIDPDSQRSMERWETHQKVQNFFYCFMTKTFIYGIKPEHGKQKTNQFKQQLSQRLLRSEYSEMAEGTNMNEKLK